MAGGAPVQLVAYGAQDVYLTGQPKVTFFQAVYKRHTNFSMEAIKHNRDFSFVDGSVTSVKIDRRGDLLADTWLELPVRGGLNLTSDGVSADTCWVAERSIKKVEFLIGGQVIDVHYQTWWRLWSECFLDKSARLLYSKMTTLPTQTAGSVILPMLFSFCRNPGLYLPLIALQNHEVRLNFEVADNYSEYFTGPPTVWANYVFLDVQERLLFAKNSHEYLIEQVQHTGGEILDSLTSRTLTRFTNPVKELVWCYQNTDGQNPDTMWNFSNTRVVEITCDTITKNPFVAGYTIIPGDLIYADDPGTGFLIQFDHAMLPVNGLAIGFTGRNSFGSSVSNETKYVYVTGFASTPNIIDMSIREEVFFSGNILPIGCTFVAKFSSDLNPLNALAIQSTISLVGYGVSATPTDVYVTGTYLGLPSIVNVNTGGPVTFSGNTFPDSGSNNWGYIAQFDTNFEPLNALYIEKATSELRVTASSSSGVYVSGPTGNIYNVASGQQIFFVNPNPIFGYTGTFGFMNTDGFVAQFDDNMNPQNAIIFDAGPDFSTNVTSVSTGSTVYVTGYYNSLVGFMTVYTLIPSRRLLIPIHFRGNDFPISGSNTYGFVAQFSSDLSTGLNALVFKGARDIALNVSENSTSFYVSGSYVGLLSIVNVGTGQTVTFSGEEFPYSGGAPYTYGFVAQFDTNMNPISALYLASGSKAEIGVSVSADGVYLYGDYTFGSNTLVNVATGQPVKYGPYSIPPNVLLGGYASFVSHFGASLNEPLAATSFTPSRHSFEIRGISSGYITGQYNDNSVIMTNLPTGREVFFGGPKNLKMPHRIGVPYNLIASSPTEETNGPLSMFSLLANGQERFKPQTGKYFNQYQPFRYHSGAPYTGIYTYSFALNPEEHQPSGAMNFSRIAKAETYTELKFDPVIQKLFAVSYNILRIKSGMGGLAFAN